jgi:hypothetical protein
MKIIGFSGKKQTGKTTGANILSKELGDINCFTVGFADALKEEIIIAINAVNILRGHEPINRTTIEQFKQHFRFIMQGWGTDFRRMMYGDRYWIEQLNTELQKAEQTGYKYAIIPDVRFLNEANFIRSKHGILIRIERMVFQNSDTHQSENELDINYPWDYTIENNLGLNGLEEKIRAISKDICK